MKITIPQTITSFVPRNTRYPEVLQFDFSVERVIPIGIVGHTLMRLEFPLADQSLLVPGQEREIAAVRARFIETRSGILPIVSCRIAANLEAESAQEGNPLTRVYLEGFSTSGRMSFTNSKAHRSSDFPTLSGLWTTTPGRFNGMYSNNPDAARFGDRVTPLVPLLGWTDMHPKNNNNLMRLSAVSTLPCLDQEILTRMNAVSESAMGTLAEEFRSSVAAAAPSFLGIV